MSETDELFGDPTEGDSGFDLEALFTEYAESPADPPPFFGETQSAAAEETPAANESVLTAKITPAAEEKTVNPPTTAEPKDKTTVPAAETVQETAAVTEKAVVTESAAAMKKEAQKPEPDLFAAFAQEEEKPVLKAATAKTEATPPAEQQVSIFDKPAVFKYQNNGHDDFDKIQRNTATHRDASL